MLVQILVYRLVRSQIQLQSGQDGGDIHLGREVQSCRWGGLVTVAGRQYLFNELSSSRALSQSSIEESRSVFLMIWMRVGG